MSQPVPLNRAALAQRYGVARSTISRALQAARTAHARDPAQLPPPAPLNPGAANELFDPTGFDRFWSARPGRGRPATSSKEPTT